MLKLDLGSGMNPAPGYTSVDKYAAAKPDVVHDLEVVPWPFEDSSVEEVRLSHVLEHLGETTDSFRGIIQELYRVCAPGALIHIAVPHPFSTAFVSDPTHVRPITPELMGLFSRKNCEHFARIGAANSPLALYWNVDFEIVPDTVQYAIDPEYEVWANQPGWQEMAKSRTNFVQEIRMVLRAIK